MDGSKEISLTYELPVETELYLLDQLFATPGKNYSVELSLVNRLTPNDSALVTWTVISGQPIFVVLKSVTQTRFTGRIMYSGCVLHFDAGYI